MPAIPAACEDFWRAAERHDPTIDRRRFLEAFAFGDSERLATLLGDLVLRGVKRATAALLWHHEQGGTPVPRPGDLSIVTDWAGRPRCIIETTSVDVVPFDEVSEDFARAEGEDDGTLASWRRNHTEFFARECRRLGRTPQPHMPVVCERFRVVHAPG